MVIIEAVLQTSLFFVVIMKTKALREELDRFTYLKAQLENVDRQVRVAAHCFTIAETTQNFTNANTRPKK